MLTTAGRLKTANGEILADGTYHILNENIQQKDRYLRLPPKDFDG